MIDTKKLKNELENDFTKGNDEYPASFSKAYSLLYYRVDDEPKKKLGESSDPRMKSIFTTQETDEEDEHNSAVQLATATKKKNETKQEPRQRRRTDMKKVTCFDCGKKGHYSGTVQKGRG